MEERDNRFELIRIAIGLADHEVIDLQIKRLRNFSTDPRLHEILRELEHKNFRQALFLMKEYVATPEDDFFAATPEEKAPTQVTQQPDATMGLFDLDAPVEAEERILGLDDMLKMTRESASAPRSYAPETPTTPSPVMQEEREDKAEEAVPEEVDPLFSLDRADDAEETPSSETDLHAEEPEPMVEQSEWPSAEPAAFPERDAAQVEAPSEVLAEVPADETIQDELFAFGEEDDALSDLSQDDFPSVPDEETGALSEETETEEALLAEEAGVAEKVTPEETPADAFRPSPEKRERKTQYAAFAYMGQKYRNMLHQFPQAETSEAGISPEVQRFIEMVSTEDYSESQVEAAIARYQALRDEGKRAEAAQMLIAAATTESTFAQFMLARELFKGDVLKQDHAEAFTQINHLAEQDYPEAICDLGQLYEYGIGIDKNKRHALLLYEEAAEMGVERAQRHYERLRGTHPVQTLASLFRRKK